VDVDLEHHREPPIADPVVGEVEARGRIVDEDVDGAEDLAGLGDDGGAVRAGIGEVRDDHVGAAAGGGDRGRGLAE
jgi:hypothetical protein